VSDDAGDRDRRADRLDSVDPVFSARVAQLPPVYLPPDLASRTSLIGADGDARRPEISGDPTDVVDRMWRPIAEEQARLDRASAPRTPTGCSRPP
jgi:hypothetical protein